MAVVRVVAALVATFFVTPSHLNEPSRFLSPEGLCRIATTFRVRVWGFGSQSRRIVT